MDRSSIEKASPRTIRYWFDFKFLKTQQSSKITQLLPLFRKSKSQLRQDLFVLCETDFKRDGYFVEFGAANGSDLSNTFLLEHHFCWKGILAEPSKYWHSQLYQNRPNSLIETKCIWNQSGVFLEFMETRDPELSTIQIFQQSDTPISKSQKVRSYSVETISLFDLLRKYDAPKHIDYLSLDTEGSEYDILESFNFDEFSFGIISVEHNYKPIREEIFKLLTQNGYLRKHENVSLFDDWYVKL
jgi:FkbM family methyltransferase